MGPKSGGNVRVLRARLDSKPHGLGPGTGTGFVAGLTATPAPSKKKNLKFWTSGAYRLAPLPVLQVSRADQFCRQLGRSVRPVRVPITLPVVGKYGGAMPCAIRLS